MSTNTTSSGRPRRNSGKSASRSAAKAGSSKTRSAKESPSKANKSTVATVEEPVETTPVENEESTEQKATGATEKEPAGKRNSADTKSERTSPSKTASRPGSSAGKRPAARTTPGARKNTGRRPIAPVKVSAGRPWGMIALFTSVGLLAAAIIGWTAYTAWFDSLSWEEQAARIPGIINYREENPDILTRTHVADDLTYSVTPPVGGDHNSYWQNCMGDVYDEPIADEHAVHSLEHGAVWITYDPERVSEADIELLADRVEGTDYMLLSPYPGQESPISLQAWGYQLRIDSASDERIDDFIQALRLNASVEPGAACSGGITVTGTQPRNLDGGGM